MGVLIPIPIAFFEKGGGQAMKRTLLIILVALVGIGLFAYPIISDYLFSLKTETAVQEYNETINQTAEDEIERIWQEAVFYNENLEGNPVHDPFLENSGMALPENYKRVLDFNATGSMGYITIPKIDVKLSIFHGTSDKVLQEGVGHMEGSSLPVGGIGSHCVLTGHTGEAHAKLFTDIRNLKSGDMFYLHILDRTLAYQVDQIKVVLPGDTSDLRRNTDNDYCTLITCTPYGVNSHRLLVRGVRAEYIPEMEAEQASDGPAVFKWFQEWNIMIGLAVGLVILIIVLIPVIVRRRKKDQKNEVERRLTAWEESIRHMENGQSAQEKDGDGL